MASGYGAYPAGTTFDPNDSRTWAVLGPNVFNPNNEMWQRAGGPTAGLPPAGQSLTTTNAYLPPSPVLPGDPSQYRATIEGRNQLVRQLYGQMPQTQNPYGDSPGRPAIHSTLMALLGMAGRSNAPGYGTTSQSLFGSDVSRLGPAAERGLVLQEPGRLNQLMQLLTGVYGLGGKTSAQAESDFAQLEQMISQNRAAKRQQLGQIPIVGPLLGGLS